MNLHVIHFFLDKPFAQVINKKPRQSGELGAL
jgi:hypothetical protein